MRAQRLEGERIEAPFRMVLSPLRGSFCQSLEGSDGPAAKVGDLVSCGDVIGFVTSNLETVEVRSPFAGQLAGLLVGTAEPVVPGQPIAWLQLAPPFDPEESL